MKIALSLIVFFCLFLFSCSEGDGVLTITTVSTTTTTITPTTDSSILGEWVTRKDSNFAYKYAFMSDGSFNYSTKSYSSDFLLNYSGTYSFDSANKKLTLYKEDAVNGARTAIITNVGIESGTLVMGVYGGNKTTLNGTWVSNYSESYKTTTSKNYTEIYNVVVTNDTIDFTYAKTGTSAFTYNAKATITKNLTEMPYCYITTSNDSTNTTYLPNNTKLYFYIADGVVSPLSLSEFYLTNVYYKQI